MLVKELIEELSKFPGDTKVFISDDGNYYETTCLFEKTITKVVGSGYCYWSELDEDDPEPVSVLFIGS